MPEDVQGPPEADASLLDALRVLAGRVDPLPAAVADAARESFTWRTIDAELAELAYDSVLDDARLAGVRSGDAPRTLTFEAPDLSVEVEVVEAGDQRRLLGQLVPPQAGEVQVRHPSGSTTVAADAVGRFSVAGLPSGPMSLRCRVGDEGAAFDTAWVVV